MNATTISGKFPAWAPAVLVEAYGKQALGLTTLPRTVGLSAFLSKEEAQRVMLALLTDERMQDVWKCLEKRARSLEKYQEQQGRPHKSNPYTDLFHVCTRIRGQFQVEPKMTASERRDYCLTIAARAHELATMIANLGRTRLERPSRLLDRDTFETLAKLLGVEDEDFKDNTPGIAADYVRFCLADTELRTTADFLWCISRAAREESDKEPAVKQPNDADAELRYFIDQLSDYFEKVYGSPLDRVTASVAGVVFGVEVDEQRVRQRRTYGNGKH